MDTLLAGAAFSALFVWWWVRKGDWNRNENGHDVSRVVTVLAFPAPRALDGVEPEHGFRPEIEGLRALAVGLVVLYHADIRALGGGFIGVDVFFVLSGFLITSLLLRELQTTGRVHFGAFWARRARRLLPASALVLVATLAASRWVLDGLTQADLAHDALAASAFAANVRFARLGTDYLTSELPPSALLHYWSLAVEEQFYLVWPALLALLTVGLRLGRRTLRLVLVALWAASLAICVRWTGSTQPDAFFLLPARAWELLTGVGLAFAAGRTAAISARLRALLGWLGLGAVVAAALVLDAGSRFPGWWSLLPVIGTGAVVAAAAAPGGPSRLLSLAPLQWVGARSYAIYLWHFPLLVLAARRWGPLPLGSRLGLVALAVVLAAASYRVVENPVRRSAALAASPVRSLVMGGWVILAGVAAAALLIANPSQLQTGEVADPAAVVTVPPTSRDETVVSTTRPVDTTALSSPATSATTTLPATTTTVRVPPADASHDNPPALEALVAANQPVLVTAAGTTKVPSNLTPRLSAARNDLPVLYDDGCILNVGQSRPKDCVYGDPAGAVTVVLFGDSHAAQWMPALDQVAQANGWRLVVHVKKACPDAEIPTRRDPNGTDCAAWRRGVIDLIGQMRPDVVVMSGYRYEQVGAAAGRDPDTVWREGIEKTVAKVRPLARQVVLLGDSATPLGDAPSCLAGNVSRVTRCTSSRDAAVRPSRLGVEREVAAAHDALFVPTTDWMCTDTDCPVIVGNVLMYRDNSHITATASRFLSPYVDATIRLALETT